MIIHVVEFANSIDSDEVAHKEPTHLSLHCLPSGLLHIADKMFYEILPSPLFFGILTVKGKSKLCWGMANTTDPYQTKFNVISAMVHCLYICQLKLPVLYSICKLGMHSRRKKRL